MRGDSCTMYFRRQLPYHQDSYAMFALLQGLPHPVWLDSNGSERGRYDILTAAPAQWFRLDRQAGREHYPAFLKAIRAHSHRDGAAPADLPFSSGLLGWFSYDFGALLQGLQHDENNGCLTPLAEVGVYLWAVVVDHELCRCDFVSSASPQQTERLLRALRSESEPGTTFSVEKLDAHFDVQNYTAAHAATLAYIRAGDCYQINLAQHYHGAFNGSPVALYQALRQISAAPFSCFFGGSAHTILSVSPERFVSVDGSRRVSTQPIKGTAPRDACHEQDRVNAERLLASEKDRAENLMIVDLLRNDLGKVCEAGSISVPQLFELQSFASVHHLVSTVEGDLSAEFDSLDLLLAAFPGGSITGAPKRRAMEIIKELEGLERQAYCGSVFYINADGRCDSNILIRSLQCHADTVHCWGGGGLVADSTADTEWQEIEDKIGAILKVLAAATAA